MTLGFDELQRTMETFMIILSLTELLYLLALHAGSATREGYGNDPDQKLGTPASAAGV